MKLGKIASSIAFALLLVGCSSFEAPEIIERAPQKVLWPNGAKAAIAITYDDALDTQLDVAVPALNAAGLRATFYVPLDRYSWNNRIEDWKRVVQSGHELGNKSIHHPCSAAKLNRNWVKAENDLDKYSIEQIEIELDRANEILSAVDGKTIRSFAFPCGESRTSEGSYYNAIKPLFIGARAVYDIPFQAGDRYNIPTFGKTNASAAEYIAYIETVMVKGEAGTIYFHGISGDYMSVSKAEHQKVIDYLAANQDKIWVDTVENIAAHMSITR